MSPFNRVSVNDIISKWSYSAYIKSSFGTRLCIFKWINETEVENVSYILDISEESLKLEPNSSSMGSSGPEFVSIPPSINNICSTNNKKNMCITLLVNLESTVGLLGKLGADFGHFCDII